MVNKGSNSDRVIVRCSDDACTWKAKFCREAGNDRNFRCNWEESNLQHSDTCMLLYQSRGLSPKALAKMPEFQGIVKSNSKSPTKALSSAVSEQLLLRVSDRTLQRSRNLVLGNKFELAERELADIGALLDAHVRLNPHDVVGLDVNASNEFVHWFIAFDNSALAHGAVLPILFCDGAHMKNPICRRFILAISALNTERQLVILAIACVKSESTESWTYMFEMFSRTALGQFALRGMLILMADRDGGLRAAARSVFPLAILRFCILHIIKNAKQAGKLGDFRLLVKIAKAGSVDERDRLRHELQRASPSLVTWLDESLLDYQYQAAIVVQRGFPICGCATNNFAEIANSLLLRPSHDILSPAHGAISFRDLTPGPMLREAISIFSRQARKFREFSLGLEVFPSDFSKHAVHMFMQQQKESKFYTVAERGILNYLVSRRGKSRHVWRDIQGWWWCDCCFQSQFKILCRHILAVFGSRGVQYSRRLLKHGGIGEFWSKSIYLQAFRSLQVLIPSEAEVFACLQQTKFPRDVRMPAPVRQRGRPKKSRFKSFTEEPHAFANSRTGRSKRARGVQCSICGYPGHTMRRCELLKPDSTADD